MKVTREQLPKSQIKLSIIVEQSEMLEYIDKTTQKIAKTITIPGFRKGEAPKEMVAKHIGGAELFNEAVEYAVNESYKQAIREQDITPLAQPIVELSETQSADGLEYTAIISVMPTITLPDYQKLAQSITKENAEITDEDEAQAKLYLQKSRGTQTPVSREVQSGDTVDLDYILTVEGKEFDKSEKMPVEIGGGKFIPGFEEEIIGLKAKDTKEFDITFPSEYHNTDLAGKLGHFAITVQEVKEVVLPEWNEVFAQELTKGEKTIEQIEQSLRDGLESERKQEVQTKYTQAIVDAIMATITTELPDVLVESERDQIIQEMEQRALYSGQSLDDALAQTGKTREALLEEALPQAESRVKLLLILRAITQEQQFVADEKEVSHRIHHILEQYSDKEQKELDMNRLKTMVSGEITDKMALDYLGNL